MLCLIALTGSLALTTGCGKEDPELTEYRDAMQGFYDTVDTLVIDLENIDLNSEDKGSVMLSCLDEMDTAFSEMAALKVPEQFANIEDLADEASANLSRAVSLYHQAFDTPAGFDQGIVNAANEYYSRAFKRISYIGTIMQGKIPEDDNITIINEDEEGGE